MNEGGERPGEGLNLASVCKSPSWQTARHLHKLTDNDALEVEAFPSDSFLSSGPSNEKRRAKNRSLRRGRSRSGGDFTGGSSQFLKCLAKS